MMKHGRVVDYGKGCRCDECRAAYSKYIRAYRASKRDPLRSRVPADKAREHVLTLTSSGACFHSIAMAAKLRFGTVRMIASGDAKYIFGRTEAAILKLTPEISHTKLRVKLAQPKKPKLKPRTYSRIDRMFELMNKLKLQRFVA